MENSEALGAICLYFSFWFYPQSSPPGGCPHLRDEWGQQEGKGLGRGDTLCERGFVAAAKISLGENLGPGALHHPGTTTS